MSLKTLSAATGFFRGLENFREFGNWQHLSPVVRTPPRSHLLRTGPKRSHEGDWCYFRRGVLIIRMRTCACRSSTPKSESPASTAECLVLRLPQTDPPHGRESFPAHP